MRGCRQDVAHEALQFPTILGLVAANTGIAIVPEAMRSLVLPGLVYRALTDAAATSQITVVTAGQRAPTALVDNVVAAIVSSRPTP